MLNNQESLHFNLFCHRSQSHWNSVDAATVGIFQNSIFPFDSWKFDYR